MTSNSLTTIHKYTCRIEEYQALPRIHEIEEFIDWSIFLARCHCSCATLDSPWTESIVKKKTSWRFFLTRLISNAATQGSNLSRRMSVNRRTYIYLCLNVQTRVLLINLCWKKLKLSHLICHKLETKKTALINNALLPQAFSHRFLLNSRQSKPKKFSKLMGFSPKSRIFLLNSREIPNFPHQNERIFC